MKQLIAVLLALMLSLTCLTAFAEGAYYEEIGLTFDFDAVARQSSNHVVLMDQGVLKHDPYLAVVSVYYYGLPEDSITALYDRINGADDEEEAAALTQTLYSLVNEIADIIVTNAATPAEAGIKDPLPEDVTLTEFGASDGYHYYFLTVPYDELLSAYDTLGDLIEPGATAEAEKEKTRADIEMVYSELLKQLQAAGLSKPVDREGDLVGQVISFETTDLDGNPVSSADLFKDNKITMVNLWGTWCGNCLNEMGELAEIHKRLQEKGCGIVGVEYEKLPLEQVADTARQIFEENGTTYPNVLMPKDNVLLNSVSGYPTTFFVDSEGKILTYPIPGAAVEDYEPTIDRLLAGETIEAVPETGATANDTGTYRVIVYDKEGNPVPGAFIELCDDTSCDFRETDAEGVATFDDKPQKVYDIHMIMAPEGYVKDEGTYKTLETFSDVNIFIEKAA